MSFDEPRRRTRKVRWPLRAAVTGLAVVAGVVLVFLISNAASGHLHGARATASAPYGARLSATATASAEPSPSPSPSPTPSPSVSPPAPPPTAFPREDAIGSAIRYLKGRRGDAALAIVDSNGTLHAWRGERTYMSASVIKAMLLVQYLRTHKTITPAMRATLTSMITWSNNDAASVVYASSGVGAAGLRRLAREAGMTRFSPRSYIFASRITAADQARFFYAMDSYIPARHRTFARYLLSHIIPVQSWGIPEVARPRWRVYFKGGWFYGAYGMNTLVHQVARLERKRVTWSLAVLTNDNPHWQYGYETLRGVTDRLLGKE